jgi:threonine dehydratase
MNTTTSSNQHETSLTDPFPGSKGTDALRSVCYSSVEAAARRLRGTIVETPCSPADHLSLTAGIRLYLKRDYLQATRSFKERGAANTLSCLGVADRKRGVWAASAGNHALGLAWHGARLGVPVNLVMPRHAARVKIDRCRRLGARVVLSGESFDEAQAEAGFLASENDCRFVHPFDDPLVIAGQGTMGLEILRQVPDVEAVVVPVGGGGLLAGLVAAIKEHRPDVRLFAVEPEAAPSFATAAVHGYPRRSDVGETLADGLAVGRVGSLGFALSASKVDGIFSVTEAEIATAMLALFESDGTVVEGAGAVALAALLAGRIPSIKGLNVVVPVCGANVDAHTFSKALQLGLRSRAESKPVAC